MTLGGRLDRYLDDLAAALSAARPDLVGVYLHGSAVLGGFRPGSSDVDVLAVVEAPTRAPEQPLLGEAVAAVAGRPGGGLEQRLLGEAAAAVAGCPGSGLELSVVTAATAAELGDCRFEVHVNTTGPEPVVVTGAGRPGDGDLVLHCVVCREYGIPVVGPPPDRVFGPVPRDRVLSAMAAELRWALRHAPPRYAVLNACRAVRFADEGRLCSKLDAGEWYLARHPGDPAVTAALHSQRHDTAGPSATQTAHFVTHAMSSTGLALEL